MKNRLYTYLTIGMCGFLSLGGAAIAQTNLNYQKPAQPILDLVDAPVNPNIVFYEGSPYALLLQRPDFPTIEAISEDVLGLAGLRIIPSNYTAIGGVSYTQIALQELASGKVLEISNLPTKLRASNISLNSDRSKLLFTNATSTNLQLWVVDIVKRQAKQIEGIQINDTYGTAFTWDPKGTKVLVSAILPNKGAVPTANKVPTGPIVQENLGGKAPSRTYQNLLKNNTDIDLLDYYLTSQPTLVDLNTGALTPIMQP